MKTDGAYTLVQLGGSLDLAAAESVRGTLLTYLADRPTALVVDVSELRVVDPAALDVFPTVSREAAQWPVGPLLFCVPTDDPSRWWADAEVTACASHQEAVAWLDSPDPGWPGPLREELAPTAGSARRARELVNEVCARWGVPEVAGSGSLAVTEMVNNVVAHAGTGMAVQLALRDGALYVAVRDYSRRPPAYAGLVPPTSTGGRGLFLIDTVARRWGTSLLDDGKLVWAVVHAEDEAIY